MSKTIRIKKALLVSGTCIMLSAAMLAGTTAAWFTDKSVSDVNVIKAGNLSIDASYQVVGEEGATYDLSDLVNFNRARSVTFSGEDKAIQDAKLITEDLWEPGAVGARLIKVANTGDLATLVKFHFDITEDELLESLWFDIVEVDEDGVVDDSFEKRPMTEMSDYLNKFTVSLLPEDDEDTTDEATFILFYGMYEEAGNEYQGKGFEATFSVIASQNTYEADDFGMDYDSDSTAVVSGYTEVGSAAQLQELLSSNNETVKIKLSKNLTLSEPLDTSSAKKVVIKGSGHTITSSADYIIGTFHNTVKLENLNLVGNGSNKGISVYSNADGLSMDNVSITNVKEGISAYKADKGTETYSIDTLKNVSIKASTTGMNLAGANAKLIKDCEVEAPTAVYIATPAYDSVRYGADATIEGGTYNGEIVIGDKGNWNIETTISVALDGPVIGGVVRVYDESFLKNQKVELTCKSGSLVHDPKAWNGKVYSYVK